MRWDIFCQIVDNYGDAGICWRLARSLAVQHQQNIRLFCDDLHTLKLLMLGSDDIQNITVLPWEASYANARHSPETPNVVIQAFSCDLPDRYLNDLILAPHKPILIHLEYLSAEPWVVDFHGKPSPQNNGLQKYFFFPGFQKETGGLLIDPIPPSQQDDCPKSLLLTWARCRKEATKLSIFSYPGAPIKQWLSQLNQLNVAFDVFIAFGNAELLSLQKQEWSNLKLISLPFIPQDDFDYLLAHCDLNIVRGEDSFVRAQLAGKPFIWNIYPQEDGAHLAKLSAFLDLYLKDVDADLYVGVTEAMAWSDIHDWWSVLPQWNQHALAWRTHLLKSQSGGGLAAKLLQFAS